MRLKANFQGRLQGRLQGSASRFKYNITMIAESQQLSLRPPPYILLQAHNFATLTQTLDNGTSSSSSTMSRLKDISTALVFRARLSTSQTHITPAPDTPWLLRGGRDALRSELEKLYWEGVKAELENIIRTLNGKVAWRYGSLTRTWQRRRRLTSMSVFMGRLLYTV